jgi:hypothetical protein
MFVSPFLSNNPYGLPVLTKNTKFLNHVFNVWLTHLKAICSKYGLETWHPPNNNIRKYLFVMKHDWTKNAFRDVINKKWCKLCKLFHLSYLPTRMAYLCSQRTPNVHIMYFMFHWFIYRLFVLNTSWKRDLFQLMIFVNVCSTCNMVELNTRFETWFTINDVNGLSSFHLSNLITLMAYLCSQWTPKFQMNSFMFYWSIYRLFVLNTSWYRDSFEMMIFANVCTTWNMVQLKPLFETSITRNNVNGVSLFHLSSLITLLAYLCSQKSKSCIICLIRRSTNYLS